MEFNLEKLFVDVFAPRNGEVVTVMYDLPHGTIADNRLWRERREMADAWHQEILDFSARRGLRVNPVVTYAATGKHNGDMPEQGTSEGKSILIDDFVRHSTIIISMPEYSATASLVGFTKKYETVRAASMPQVTKSAQETALAADYEQIAAICDRLTPLFERARGIEVTFSTGHSCYFDTSDNKRALRDDGRLHPGNGNNPFRVRNLPSGEAWVVPNEAADSQTAGEIPVMLGREPVVFVVKNNRIVNVEGSGDLAAAKRQAFRMERALGNVAEVAIGCNDKAVVSGNLLEDEKAGFHWAYGRSEHIGGTVGPDAFSSPDRVQHRDIVYAKGSPIVCARLDFIFPDGSRNTAIVDGLLTL
jgi:aminopeptidase